MDGGDHEGQERKLRLSLQANPHAPSLLDLHSADDENMKEVDLLSKEEIDKARFPVTHCTHGFGKVKRRSVCKRKGHLAAAAAASAGLRPRAPHVGQARGMANKENELTCEGAQGVHHSNDNMGFPVSSTDASKMAGASSKCSDYFTELSKDHEAMNHVLFGRNLRLNVALTLWRKNASELVAYLIRIQDMGVLLDCLPVITKSLQDEAPCISLGCCVDLLPQVKTVLASKYEEHLTVGLHWILSVIKKWLVGFSTNGKSCSEDKNLEVLQQHIKELWGDGSRFSSVPGTTGDIAKTIESYLSQLR